MLAALIIRLGAALLCVTSFVPDEYYQGVEPAYKQVYGQGISSWEWEPGYRIRSFLNIQAYVWVFQALRAWGLDSPLWFSLGPRLLQGGLAAISDILLYDLIHKTATLPKVRREQAALLTVVLHLGNWCWLYCSTRTLANSTETIILIVVLYLLYGTGRPTFLAQDSGGSFAKCVCALSLLLLQCYARPTAILFGAPILLYLYLEDQNSLQFTGIVLTIAVAIFAVGVSIDTYGYACDYPVVSPWNFIQRNVLEGVSSLFGRHPWHWNLSTGLPTVLGLSCPAMVWAYYYAWRRKLLVIPFADLLEQKAPIIEGKQFRKKQYNFSSSCFQIMALIPILYPIGLQVCSNHQEIRFLLPVLPAAHAILGITLTQWMHDSHTNLSKQGALIRKNYPRGWLLVAIPLGINLTLGFYLLTRHQAGPELAMRELAYMLHNGSYNEGIQAKCSTLEPCTILVLVLAPCYSFPGYSFLHPPDKVSLKLISPECSPFAESTAVDKKGKNYDNNSLQSRRFIEDPYNYYLQEGQHLEADYILSFDAYARYVSSEDEVPTIEQRLLTSQYRLIREFHHADFRYDYDSTFTPRTTVLYGRK